MVWYPGLLYTYLAEGVGNTTGRGAFQALQRGFTHWSTGPPVSEYQTPLLLSRLVPDDPIHEIWSTILLGRDTDFATIERAMCECAAGYVLVYDIWVYYM